MKLLAATVMSFSLLASASAQTNQAGAVSGTGAATRVSVQDAQTIKITRSGSQPSRQAPAENFTGSVRVDPLFQANAPARAFGARVTFEPGARTGWDSHLLGQILIVTAGSGLVRRINQLLAAGTERAVGQCGTVAANAVGGAQVQALKL